MTDDIDGGAAFPHAGVQRNAGTTIRFSSDGMSLRDWFAGQALISMNWANPVLQEGPFAANSVEAVASRARLAYRQADALLLARKEQEL